MKKRTKVILGVVIGVLFVYSVMATIGMRELMTPEIIGVWDYESRGNMQIEFFDDGRIAQREKNARDKWIDWRFTGEWYEDEHGIYHAVFGVKKWDRIVHIEGKKLIFDDEIYAYYKVN